MSILKVLISLLWLAAPYGVLADAPDEAELLEEEGVPAIRPVDRQFLTQLARRSMEATLQGNPAYRPTYVPGALETTTAQFIVKLRQHGYARGVGISTPMPAIKACQEAARLALVSAQLSGPDDVASLGDLRIEIEAIGKIIPYEGAVPWTDPGVIDAFLDPGHDGVRILLDDDQRWFSPAEMVARNASLTDAIRTLSKELSLDSRVVPEGSLAKFRTLHWVEVGDDGHVATLRRGMVPLTDADVTDARVRDALRRLARHLIYRQQPSGRFTVEYVPANDLYTTDENETAQSGAAWALAAYAASTGDSTVREAAERSILARRAQVIDISDLTGAGFVYCSKTHNDASVTAEYCLALTALRAGDRFAADIDRVAAGMRWLQRPSGVLVPAFPPQPLGEQPDRTAGMVLLALARVFEQNPSAAVVNVFDRALPVYRERFRATRSLAMAPWHTQAFARMARRLKKKRFADFAFELADHLCTHQLHAENAPTPEVWGAFSAGTDLAPGATSAVFVAALADAAQLARETGATMRFHRYRAACRRATRFLLQLQVQPAECFYMRSPQDAVNGVRLTAVDCRIRVDAAQHTLLALLKVYPLLFEPTQ